MDTVKKPPTMRQLMRAGFTRTLAQATGLDTAAISNLVTLEQHTRKGWPDVLKLAEETDPAGFAQWAAANPEKLPKVTA